MPHPATTRRWSRGELHRGPRGDRVKDAIDALVAGVLLTVALLMLLG